MQMFQKGTTEQEVVAEAAVGRIRTGDSFLTALLRLAIQVFLSTLALRPLVARDS